MQARRTANAITIELINFDFGVRINLYLIIVCAMHVSNVTGGHSFDQALNFFKFFSSFNVDIIIQMFENYVSVVVFQFDLVKHMKYACTQQAASAHTHTQFIIKLTHFYRRRRGTG